MNKTPSLDLPPSVLASRQVKTFRADYTEQGREVAAIVKVRYDDECHNGHNSFAVTCDTYTRDCAPGEATVTSPTGKTLWQSGGGCDHETVAKRFPELAHLIKWHLVSSDGPMHYGANVAYLAGNRDHWGLLKGEFRQHTSRGPRQNGGVEGVPRWELRLPKGQPTEVYSNEKPAPVTLEWQPSGITGEGKERELDSARRAAVWPEATDAELTEPGLEARLLARLPALMADFRRDVEALGFTY